MADKNFSNWNSLIKYLEIEVVNNLKKIGEEVKSVLKTRLLVDWYNSYSPEYYQRTNMLIDSISITQVTKLGNTYEIKIYFDEEKIKPVPATIKGYFPAHMNITDGASNYEGMTYGELLPLWVEKGQHSSIHSYLGVHMVENTIDWLKEDRYLRNRMKELLENYGFKCI